MQELSNMLLHAANEDALRGLDMVKFVEALLALLNYEHNGEIMLLGVRALCGLMEALPQSCATIIGAHGVEQLCAKLLMITYVDVAEECIRAIHRLAMEAPGPVLREGAMAAVLAYLDFFSVSVQRRAVEAASHMCRGATAEFRAQVEGSLDTLLRLLEYEDAQVAAHALEALTMVAEHWANSRELTDALHQDGRTTQAILRVLGDPAAPGWGRAARLMQLGCLASTTVLLNALQQGLAAVLAAAATPERALDTLMLVGELFPQLPATATFPQKKLPVFGGLAAAAAPAAAAAAGGPSADPRAALMQSEQQLYENVLASVLPLLIRAYAESASSQVRSRAVIGLARAALSAPLPLLEQRIELAPFLATLLRERSTEAAPMQALALCISSRLLQGLAKPFASEMQREGLGFAVAELRKRLEKLKGAANDNNNSNNEFHAWVAGLCRDSAFSTDRLGDSEEERALAKAAKELEANPTAFVALVTARPPSAWEVQRALVAEALAELKHPEALWAELVKVPQSAQSLIDALLQRCGEEVLADESSTSTNNNNNGLDLVDPGLAVKIMMQPIPIGLRARDASVDAFPDSGGAAVEPLTKMSRLSEFVWERIDAAAVKAKLPPRNPEQEDEDDNLEDEISGMDESDFRDYMSSRLSDLSSMEPEQRGAQLARLKKAIATFASSARTVPQVDEEEVEGVPAEEAQQLRQAAEEARAALARQASTRPKLEFRIGTQVARPDQTLYAFLVETLKQKGRSLWAASPVLEYGPAAEVVTAAPFVQDAPRGASERALGLLFQQHERKPCGLKFLSSRLNGAVAAATHDLLACAAGALPAWALAVSRSSPWMLPLATRRLLLERSAYGALACLGDVVVAPGKGYSYDGNQSVFQFGRVPRAKIRVSREKIWETARAAMQMYAGVRSQLEVEYFSEVGVGLGPTLEFWTLVSREMQLQSLGLWLDSSAASPGGHCVAPGPAGLFPRPQQSESVEWELVGTLMAKAMLDGRLLDLPLAPHFWRVMLGDTTLGLDDLQHLYPETYTVLAELAKGSAARYDAADLGLCFTLAGRDEWELVPGGASISLTRDNAAL